MSHTMKKLFVTLLAGLCLSPAALAQRPSVPPRAYIYVNDAPQPLQSISTQTETRPGWDIQGISVGRKAVRYLYGKQSRQRCGVHPTWALYPDPEKLNDYALIRLKVKRDHRRLPSTRWEDCPRQRVELPAFRIENLPDMGFAVTPVRALEPGEYILVNLAAPPVNEQGDLPVFDFSVSADE